MAHIGDWIPHAQDTFVPWSQKYVAGVSTWATPLGLPTTAVTALTNGETGFMAAWNELVVQEINASVSAAKKALIDGRKAAIRKFHNQYIRYNPALTDEMRAAMGVPIPDRTHTHIVVGDRRVAFDLEPKGVFLVELKCRDEETGEKKILYGMSGIVAIYAITDGPVTDDTLLTESVLLTKPTHTFRAAAAQRGKWLSVTVCWQSETGEKGPWAAVQSAIIP